MTTIVCVGACYIDTILTVPHFPEEDAKLRATSLSKRRGGNCPNTLEVLQQLIEIQPKSPPPSLPTSPASSSSRALHTVSLAAPSNAASITDAKLILLATLPARASQATRLIVESLRGVDLSHCIFRDECNEAASSYIIKNVAQDSRTIVNYNELAEMSVAEFIATANAVGRGEGAGKGVWWHFEGRIPEITLACIKYLRAVYAHSKISVEVEKPGREGLQELAAQADVVFFSKSWAQSLGYTTPRPFLETQGAQLNARNPIIFCTWGALGATSYHDGIVGFAQSPVNTRVEDPIGAGDTFIAGVLFSLALRPNLDVSRALQLGTIVAGEKVRREGFQGLKEALRDYVGPWGIQ